MKDKILHSPIKSFGGKGSNAFMTHIYSLFPKEFEVYIEPFCGSAVIALNNPVKKCATIINDYNLNIYSVFKCLQDKKLFERFKEKCDLYSYHERLFQEYKQILKRDDLDIVDRAFYFFMVNRISFSGNCQSFGVNRIIRRNISKSTSDLLSTIDGLNDFNIKMSEFVIYHRDGVELIKSEDAKKNNTFFYLDPPYVWETRTNARYEVDFSDEQQIELIDVLVKCKSKILLSGYDNQLYEKRLVQENGWKRYDYEIKTVTGSNQKRTKIESLWYNYDPTT